jgi:glycosyltransferase involved in cell wall biosynthesis
VKSLNLFHPGEKTKNVQLIYFGGLRKYKRPEYAIKIYEDLHNEIKDLKLVITGDGPLLNKIKDDIKNKNYNIDFLGKIDYKKLADIIRESWVNLHFSVTEGWGLSIMESSASGTPSFAFKVPGVVDTIKDGYNGYLLNDINDFKYKILYIIKMRKNSARTQENLPRISHGIKPLNYGINCLIVNSISLFILIKIPNFGIIITSIIYIVPCFYYS